MFASFVDERLPRASCSCGRCIDSHSCWRRWYLYATGELRPFVPTLEQPTHDRPDVWAVWPSCPRHHLEPLVAHGGDDLSFAEWARWQVERGAHRRRRIVSRAESLLRLYTLIRERPKQLREHIHAEKLKSQREKSRGGR